MTDLVLRWRRITEFYKAKGGTRTAAEFGISRQRVYDIVKKYRKLSPGIPETGKERLPRP